MSNKVYKKYKPSENMRLYLVWYAMIHRCTDKKSPRYKYYGQRGISVCKEWVDSFESFADWAFHNGYDKDAPYGQCTLDRINNDGDYRPSNCRWVSFKVQNNNKREYKSKHQIEYNGETHSISKWSEITGIPYHTLLKRKAMGWSAEDIITKPIFVNRHREL